MEQREIDLFFTEEKLREMKGEVDLAFIVEMVILTKEQMGDILQEGHTKFDLSNICCADKDDIVGAVYGTIKIVLYSVPVFEIKFYEPKDVHERKIEEATGRFIGAIGDLA